MRFLKVGVNHNCVDAPEQGDFFRRPRARHALHGEPCSARFPGNRDGNLRKNQMGRNKNERKKA
jgi:hypothetical protein